MAYDKVPGNVDGPFYVEDGACDQCGNCHDVAPNNFSEGDGSYIVSKQPDTDEEYEACEQADIECPMAAIWDDGKEN